MGPGRLFGVVLVTTKSGAGSDGKPTVQYSGRFGWKEPTMSTDFETRGYYSVYLNDLFYKSYAGVNYSRIPRRICTSCGSEGMTRWRILNARG